MTDSIKATDFDPELTPTQVEQVQEVINEVLRRRIAEDEAPLREEIARLTAELEAAKIEKPVVVKKLSDYQNGEDVEVIKNGEWTKGIVNGVERKLNLVYVHTSRGPATVGNPSSIRAVSAD